MRWRMSSRRHLTSQSPDGTRSSSQSTQSRLHKQPRTHIALPNFFPRCSRAFPVISQDFACLIKFKAWCSGAKFARIPVTNIADKIRFPGGALKKDLIHLGIVKSRHRTTIEPKGTSGNDEIRALQAAVAKSGRFDNDFFPTKPF